MVHSTRPAACHVTLTADELVNRLLALREALTARRESRAVVACQVWDLIDDVRRSAVAPVAGGSPDDFEEFDPEFEADPANWPAWTDADRWVPTFDGPTPLEILERDAEEGISFDPTPETVSREGFTPGGPGWSDLASRSGRFVPSQADWDDYASWCERQGYGVTDEDLIAAGLAVG